MLTRRDVLRSVGLAATATGTALLAGCGERARTPVAEAATVGRDGQAKSAVRREVGDPADATVAAEAARAFGADLHRYLAASDGNVVTSPYSVAVALTMTRNGARGRTAAEMDQVLHGSPQQLNGGLNALETLLEGTSGRVRRADGSAAEVTLRVANSLWGQRDLAWETPFLDVLARHYGAGMRLVDYTTDWEGARKQINAWTAERTDDKISDLLPQDVLHNLTRLVLVNAVYLKAPWEQPFVPELTQLRPFRRADGSTVDVPTMAAEVEGVRYGRGAGWQAAELRYAGSDLAMTVVLPDRDLAALERDLDGARLARMLGSLGPVPALRLRLPRWRFRTPIPLDETLKALGMPTAFDRRLADFGGMTLQERLSIGTVRHEAVITVDEQGTEAAAATAVVMETLSAGPTPVPLVVDRPFLFVVHHVATATPLFVGRVADPAATDG